MYCLNSSSYVDKLSDEHKTQVMEKIEREENVI